MYGYLRHFTYLMAFMLSPLIYFPPNLRSVSLCILLLLSSLSISDSFRPMQLFSVPFYCLSTRLYMFCYHVLFTILFLRSLPFANVRPCCQRIHSPSRCLFIPLPYLSSHSSYPPFLYRLLPLRHPPLLFHLFSVLPWNPPPL